LTERLVQPALHAIQEAIEGIEQRREGRPSTILARTGFSDTAFNAGSRSSPKLCAEFRRSSKRASRTFLGPKLGIGNVLRHEYHRISDTLIRNVVQEYLPPLRVAVAAIEAEQEKQS
jgi:hypothetical protein